MMASKLAVLDRNLKNVVTNRTRTSGDKGVSKETRLPFGERNVNYESYECETKGKMKVANNKSEKTKYDSDKENFVARNVNGKRCVTSHKNVAEIKKNVIHKIEMNIKFIVSTVSSKKMDKPNLGVETKLIKEKRCGSEIRGVTTNSKHINPKTVPKEDCKPNTLIISNSQINGGNMSDAVSQSGFKSQLVEKEYIFDNLKYLHQREKLTPVNPSYLETHLTVNSKRRSILVDWLIEVALRCNGSDEALFLAVTYVDRFLTQCPIEVRNLQLLGVTAMLIAFKYEEPRCMCIDMDVCLYLTENTYTRPQICEMEIGILNTLKFDVGNPTTNTFLNIFSVLGKMKSVEIAIAKYIAELALLDGARTLKFLPSMQAASALLLGKCAVIKKTPSQLTMTKAFGYNVNQLKSCMDVLCEIHREAPQMKYGAVRDKYLDGKYYSATNIPLCC